MTAVFWVGLVLICCWFVGTVGFDIFCWAFCTVDAELQERHWKKLRQNKKQKEAELKVFFEERAA